MTPVSWNVFGPRGLGLLVARPSAEPAARLRDLLTMLQRGEQQRSLDQQARRLREQKLGADEELALLQQMIEQERTRQGI